MFSFASCHGWLHLPLTAAMQITAQSLQSHKQDCSSFSKATVYPATVTQTSYQTVYPFTSMKFSTTSVVSQTSTVYPTTVVILDTTSTLTQSATVLTIQSTDAEVTTSKWTSNAHCRHWLWYSKRSADELSLIRYHNGNNNIDNL